MFRLSSPLNAQMEVTEACNNACIHCYNYWRYLETGELLDRDDRTRSLGHFLAILDEIINAGVATVAFTGGEPFLRRDILFDLVAHAKHAGLDVSINTNGALMTTGDVQRVVELSVDSLIVSLLSSRPGTHNDLVSADTFTKTSKAIQMLARTDVVLDVNMVTSKKNWQQVRETAEYVKSLGGTAFSTTPVIACHLSSEHLALMLSGDELRATMHDLLWVKNELGLSVAVLEPIARCLFTKEERKLFKDFVGTRICMGGISDCAISADGDLRACIMSSDIGGNVTREGIYEAWANLSHWKEAEMLPSRCLICSYVDRCGGGCRVAAFSKTGSLRGEDPYMTEPLTEGIDCFECTSEEYAQKVEPDTKLRPHSQLRLRKEEFGGALIVRHHNMFLNGDAFNLFTTVVGMGEFTVREIVSQLGTEGGETTELISAILSRGFLYVID